MIRFLVAIVLLASLLLVLGRLADRAEQRAIARRVRRAEGRDPVGLGPSLRGVSAPADAELVQAHRLYSVVPADEELGEAAAVSSLPQVEVRSAAVSPSIPASSDDAGAKVIPFPRVFDQERA